MRDDVILLLGSNTGRRVKNLRDGIDFLSRDVPPAAVSRIHAGEPAGRGGQPWFLNVAVRGETALSPDELLRLVKEAEAAAGRRSGARWGPRALDVDIILAGNRVVNEPHLAIPHRSMAVRRFCLLPVAEIAPDRVVPPGDKTVRDLLARCPDPLEVFPI